MYKYLVKRKKSLYICKKNFKFIKLYSIFFGGSHVFIIYKKGKMELGKKKKNTKLIRIIDIRDYGRNHELFCNNNLLLRTARKPGDIERVNHTVLGCLNRAGVKYEIIDENKKNDIMKININESQLKRIISESVKKVLKESYNDDMHMYNYKDAMSDKYEDLSVESIVDGLKYEDGVDLGECPYIWEPANWENVLQYATESGYNTEEVRECILEKLNLDIKMTQQSIEAVKNWRFQQ